MEYSKTYEFDAKHGSKVKVKIAAEIENLNKDDVQEILHEYAARSRNFYLGMGNDINNMP